MFIFSEHTNVSDKYIYIYPVPHVIGCKEQGRNQMFRIIWLLNSVKW
jgi:hypothetical protein